MRAKEFFKRMRTLLAEDKLEIVLKELRVYLRNSQALDEIILYSARYSDVMKQIRLDVIDFENADIKKNKIRYALIDMIGMIEAAAEEKLEVVEEIGRVTSLLESKVTFTNSKNINVGDVNTGGGNFRIGDDKI